MRFSQQIKIMSALSLGFIGLASAAPQELLNGLADENYHHREKAEKELIMWAKKKGKGSLVELNELKKRARSPEVKSRLENVISGVVVYKAIPGTRGFMGISMNSMLGTAVIITVNPDSPAAKAGLQPNDKILGLDDIDLTKKNNHVNEATNFLRIYVKNKKAGEKLRVHVERDGRKFTTNLKLGDYDKYIRTLDPFGDNRGFPMPQMNNGGIRGNLRMLPAPRNLDPKQLKEMEKLQLELNLEVQKRLLDQAELSPELADILKKQNEKNQERIDSLKKELKLEVEKPKALKK